MMKTRKSFDITDVNKLGMFSLYMWAIEQDRETPTLVISGDRGYEGYMMDVRFLGLAYIACASFIKDNFSWRLATEEEAAAIQHYTDEPLIRIYCMEEHVPRSINPSYLKQAKDNSSEEPFLFNRPARKYFIAALGVEITLSYSEELEEKLCDWGHLA